MGLFSNLFKKKSADSTSTSISDYSVEADHANDPNMIKVLDEYGREMFITKQQWRDNVLLGNLEKHRNSPDDLYGMLVGALEDGFAADIICYAEHLKRIDLIPARGATILSIVYMEVNRLDDAQRILDEHIAQYGEEGFVLTNLAKVYSRRGDDVHAEAILWHALELDPNQDNGLGWYAAIQRERQGKQAELDGFRRVAALPRSWRARLWLAREALQQNDLIQAKALYQEALAVVEQPIPTDLLMQMSGDLGNSGCLNEIIHLAGPYFDPVYHGLEVGNNLIKANLELGRLQEARLIVNQLYGQQRSDWKQTLSFWDTELAKAETAIRAEETVKEPSLSLFSIESSLWMRAGSPFSALLPAKRSGAIRIAVLGSTALMGNTFEKPALQLSDSTGRLSRSIPLMIAELVHFTTDAVGIALMPWAQGQGFALFGHPYEDAAICEIAGNGDNTPDYVIGLTIDATLPAWRINLHLLRRADAKRLAEISVDADIENLGTSIEALIRKVSKMLVEHAEIHHVSTPAWYQRPAGYYAADYLLRLEQLLCVACQGFDFLEGGGIHGEREMLDGSLRLCVNEPSNCTARMLYAQMLRLMNKVRPEILSGYKDKTAHLQRDYPIEKDIDLLIDKAVKEVFPAQEN